MARVFGDEGKLSSLNELMKLIDSQDCNGIEYTFMDKIAVKLQEDCSTCMKTE